MIDLAMTKAGWLEGTWGWRVLIQEGGGENASNGNLVVWMKFEIRGRGVAWECGRCEYKMWTIIS